MPEPHVELFTTAAMAALFAPDSHVGHMLHFEAALARAQAHEGLMPSDAAAAIATACQVEQFDVAALYREAATAGTLAIPLVRALTERVAGQAGRYVHLGATSQDAIDTAMVLQMRQGLHLLEVDLRGVCDACAALAVQHRRTLMPGRTLLQQALPITFGLKAARWLALAMRQMLALRVCRQQSLAVQFGGAAGTLAALGDVGLRVAERLAHELSLPLPDLPWHAERDRVATIVAALGVVAGSMAKIAHDIMLLAQTEVGEATEAAVAGKGGSSALPQKRNPVDATMALAAARLAIGVVPVVLSALAQEHERAAGGWQAEWVALPDVFRYTAGAVARVRSAVSELHVDAERMRANLDLGNGLLMAEAVSTALAAHVGRPEAQRLVKHAAGRVEAEGITFRAALLADATIRAALSDEVIDRALDPAAYLGSADALIDRAVQAYRALQEAR